MKIGLTNIVSCKIGSTQVNRVYIGSTLIWSYSAFDPDAQLFITNAAITEPVQQNAVNNLVIDLKNYGIWSKVKFLHPMVGGTASQHKFNLKNPLDTDAAFRLVFNGGWTHSATGALPNGTNAYADTFFVPSVNLNTTDFSSFGYYSRSNTAKTGEYVMGSNSGATQAACALIIRRNTNLWMANGDFPSGAYRAALNSSSTDGTGFFMGTIDASDAKLYRNGSIVIQNTTASLSQPLGDKAIVIGAIRSTSGTPEATPVIGGYTDKECSMSLISNSLTDTEAFDLYTAVDIFQTTLGRNV